MRKLLIAVGQFFTNKRRSGTTTFLKTISDQHQGKIWVLVTEGKEAGEFGENGLSLLDIQTQGRFFEDRPILVDNAVFLKIAEAYLEDINTEKSIAGRKDLFIDQLEFLIRDFKNGRFHRLDSKDAIAMNHSIEENRRMSGLLPRF